MHFKQIIAAVMLMTMLTACTDRSDSVQPDTDESTGICMSESESSCITETVTSASADENNHMPDDITTSEGYFLPCTNGSFLLIIENYGATEIHPENNDMSIFEGLSAGDRVSAVHGIILETYPGMTEVYSIEKISDGDISDISPDLLYDLESMGWTADVPQAVT